MPVWLYETGANGLWVFLLLTVAIGGAAAWATGRAVARTWQPWWQVPVYAALLAAGVRFLHYSLFEEPFLAASNLAVDYVVLLVGAGAGHRLTRADQLARQYYWLSEKSAVPEQRT